MKRLLPLAAILLLPALACAQEKGTWHPVSSTARAITGDVSFGKDRVSINFASFPLLPVRTLQPSELTAVFNPDDAAGATGTLYRLSVPASQHFLHKNTLCGSDATQWMATFVSGRNLQLAFFSGAQTPTLTPEAVQNTTSLCGTYSYSR